MLKILMDHQIPMKYYLFLIVYLISSLFWFLNFVILECWMMLLELDSIKYLQWMNKEKNSPPIFSFLKNSTIKWNPNNLKTIYRNSMSLNHLPKKVSLIWKLFKKETRLFKPQNSRIFILILLTKSKSTIYPQMLKI